MTRFHIFSRNYTTTERRIQNLEDILESRDVSACRIGNSVHADGDEYVFYTFRFQKGGFDKVSSVPDGEAVDVSDLIRKIDEFRKEVLDSVKNNALIEMESFRTH